MLETATIFVKFQGGLNRRDWIFSDRIMNNRKEIKNTNMVDFIKSTEKIIDKKEINTNFSHISRNILNLVDDTN